MPVIPGFHIFERLRKEELSEFFPNTSGLLSQGKNMFLENQCCRSGPLRSDTDPDPRLNK
jgi:hypothetical protein